MDLSARINELKKENDKDAETLQRLDVEKSNLIQGMLTRNGRILELTEMLEKEAK